MSFKERSIVSIIDPTIKVDKITAPEDDTRETKNKKAFGDDAPSKLSSQVGAIAPYIIVGTTKIEPLNINMLTLSFSDKIPKLNFTYSDTNQRFKVEYPLDGTVVSLYLRPQDVKNTKPIRLDFDIENINSEPNSGIYSFNCILKIPGIFSEKLTTLESNTSFNHLMDICEELGLGFSTNDDSTDDVMTRICPYENYQVFIDEIVESSYKDDDSFFTWTIDPYYYLNFVNINKQFNEEDEAEPTNINMSGDLDPSAYPNEDANADANMAGSLILSNAGDKRNSNLFINNYSLVNNCGETWINNGYKRYVQYYDIDSDEFINNFVDPLTTNGSENSKIILKGKKGDDFYKSQIKYKFIGKQSSENLHDNYQFSKILNLQNLQEIQKMYLRVHMENPNFYLYKWQRVPVAIYEDNSQNNTNQLESRDESLGEPVKTTKDNDIEGLNKNLPENELKEVGAGEHFSVKNNFLSGYYVIGAIEYNYVGGSQGFTQDLILYKREWDIPAENLSKGVI